MALAEVGGGEVRVNRVMGAMGELVGKFSRANGKDAKGKRNDDDDDDDDDDLNPELTLWSNMILDKIPTGN